MKRSSCVLIGVVLILCALAGPSSGAEPLTVAVVPLRNSSGKAELDVLSEGLSDMLIAALSRSEDIRLVERQSLDKILSEQKLALAALTKPATAARVGKLLGAKALLMGGFTVAGEKLKLNVHIYDVETAALLKSEAVEGTLSDISELCDKLSVAVLKGLNVKARKLPKFDVDKSPVANLHFARGLGYYHSGQYDRAIGKFTTALHLEKTHVEARFWNAKSYYALKEFAHAKIELEKFLKDSTKHPRAKECRKMLKACDEKLEGWEKELFGEQDKKKATK